MDVPSIELAAAVVGGVGLGAVLAAVSSRLGSLGEAGLQALSEEGGRYAGIAGRVLGEIGAVQARLLVGQVLCGAVAAALVGYSFLQTRGSTAAIVGVLLVAVAYALFATVASTALGRRSGVATLRLWKWMRPVEVVLKPVAAPLTWINRLAQRLIPEVQEKDAARLTELAVEHVIEQGEEAGSIAEDHAEMLRSVLEFKNTVAREIMVPRTQMVAFEIEKEIDEVVASVIASGHSRYPIYREQIDQVEGILYAKDLFKVLRRGESSAPIRLADLVRTPVPFVAETQKIGVLLKEMQRGRFHLAVVVDEFGGAAGIVTLEDIIEEIVGEIQDEHDEEAPLISERKPGHYFVDAGISVYDLEERLGESICDDKSDFDTLAGLLVHLAGRVPVIGESLTAGPYRLIVLNADERHVSRVEMLRDAVEPDGQPQAATA